MSISNEFDRAFRLHQQGKLREAFLRYDAVLAADPQNAPALHYSGVVLYQAGKIPEAAERIRASLELEPTSADAWSNLALVLDSAGRREAALNALSEAAKLAPHAPEIFANLAATLTALGRVNDAERLTFQFVSSNDPDLIGVEVMLDGNLLIDVSMDEDGRTSVLFDTDGGQFEFDLTSLRTVLDKCETELSAWRQRLMLPGEIWGND